MRFTFASGFGYSAIVGTPPLAEVRNVCFSAQRCPCLAPRRSPLPHPRAEIKKLASQTHDYLAARFRDIERNFC